MNIATMPSENASETQEELVKALIIKDVMASKPGTTAQDFSISELCRWDCRQSFLVEGGRRGGGKSPMLWQVFSVQMANSRRFMQLSHFGLFTLSIRYN